MSRILYVQYTNPAGYPPLEHSSRILADAGFDVLFLGTGALGSDPLRFPGHDRITVRQLPFTPAGWRQKLNYLIFNLWVIRHCFSWRPKWVYASDYLSCPAALSLSYLPRVQIIYHEHDSPVTRGASVSQRICFAARRKLAHRARLNVLPNQQRAAQFAREVGVTQNVVCIWNCPSRQEIAAPRNGSESDDLWILYHGSIVPARLPISVLGALKLLPASVKLRVIGYETVGYQGYVRELRNKAEQLRIDERIEFVGPVPRRKLLALGRKCDVGLAFMPRESDDLNERAMTGASNKPFDYLACGLALLVSDLPDWRKIFVEPGYALACDSDDPTSIANSLRWFLDHRPKLRHMGESGRRKIASDWNYETFFQPVIEGMFRRG